MIIKPASTDAPAEATPNPLRTLVGPKPPVMEQSFASGNSSAMGLSGAGPGNSSGGTVGFVPFSNSALSLQPQQQAVAAAIAAGDSDLGPKQLIVNYLSLVVTEGELRQLFEQFGPVECARVIYDKNSGVSKGYGFVYFAHSAHAALAIRWLNGFELYGKYLRISYAVPQRPMPA